MNTTQMAQEASTGIPLVVFVKKESFVLLASIPKECDSSTPALS
jgi:hypothetical protein